MEEGINVQILILTIYLFTVLLVKSYCAFEKNSREIPRFVWKS